MAFHSMPAADAAEGLISAPSAAAAAGTAGPEVTSVASMLSSPSVSMWTPGPGAAEPGAVGAAHAAAIASLSPAAAGTSEAALVVAAHAAADSGVSKSMALRGSTAVAAAGSTSMAAGESKAVAAASGPVGSMTIGDGSTGCPSTVALSRSPVGLAGVSLVPAPGWAQLVHHPASHALQMHQICPGCTTELQLWQCLRQRRPRIPTAPPQPGHARVACDGPGCAASPTRSPI